MDVCNEVSRLLRSTLSSVDRAAGGGGGNAGQVTLQEARSRAQSNGLDLQHLVQSVQRKLGSADLIMREGDAAGCAANAVCTRAHALKHS